MKKEINIDGGSTNLLATLFIGLKLTDNIDWSWVWVLAPFWIPLALYGFVFMIWLIAQVLK